MVIAPRPKGPLTIAPALPETPATGLMRMFVPRIRPPEKVFATFVVAIGVPVPAVRFAASFLVPLSVKSPPKPASVSAEMVSVSVPDPVPLVVMALVALIAVRLVKDAL